MTLTEMRYIVALARERHFGKAAEACHVSQPTLSVALKKVEGQLGAALFERTANEVRITALGERIVAQARRVLEEAVKLFDEQGVSHGEIKDLGGLGICVLAFRDPDNIQVELTAPK